MLVRMRHKGSFYAFNPKFLKDVEVTTTHYTTSYRWSGMRTFWMWEKLIRLVEPSVTIHMTNGSSETFEFASDDEAKKFAQEIKEKAA